jgi:hypothetical protein
MKQEGQRQAARPGPGDNDGFLHVISPFEN